MTSVTGLTIGYRHKDLVRPKHHISCQLTREWLVITEAVGLLWLTEEP